MGKDCLDCTEYGKPIVRDSVTVADHVVLYCMDCVKDKRRSRLKSC